MDREISTNEVAVSQVLSDNFSGAVAIGEYFVEKLQQKGSYVELLGLLGDNNTKNRSEGFHSVVDNFPELKMVAQQTADFGSTQSSVKVQIQQVSTLVGAGNTAEATL